MGEFIVGTSGYSYADWVGGFYPAGTRPKDMFAYYARQFRAVELNFTFYRMPAAKTLAAMAGAAPDGFTFWVKANRRTTHEADRTAAAEFIEALGPLIDAGKFAGVLAQFPQRFHRTAANRKLLAGLAEDFAKVPLAVEFRHRTWDHPSTLEGLRARAITLVVPDSPLLADLYRPAPAATSDTAYLRFHSRDAAGWYAGIADRYDYDYSDAELKAVLEGWSEVAVRVGKVFAFFNNCHAGKAARNARRFQEMACP